MNEQVFWGIAMVFLGGGVLGMTFGAWICLAAHSKPKPRSKEGEGFSVPVSKL